ncbi:MAG: S-DNA-T family DNA segregation ATPase FtsK/SpoIIIE [Candidatus Binatia bacterium]|jgi:S-DNA-T family DNA segregation ATPase FtsK/SpoIIIE
MINRGGPVGFAISNMLIQSFGLAAYIFPSLLLLAGVVLFFNRGARLAPIRLAGGFFLLVQASIILGVYRNHVTPDAAGGWVGGFLGTLLVGALGDGGTGVALVTLTLLIFMMLTGRTVTDLMRDSAGAANKTAGDTRVALTKSATGLRASLGDIAGWKERLPFGAGRFGKNQKVPASAGPAVVYSPVEPAVIELESAPDADPPRSAIGRLADRARQAGPKIERGPLVKEKKDPTLAQEEFIFEVDDANFRLPPTNLLGDPDDRSVYVDEKALVDSSGILEQKLATFGVNGRVTAVRPGPVITTYEFEPEAGVKVSRVVNLCDDLTMALRAHGVRIVAPIPGKNVVGIEVSNRSRAMVGIRDLIESEDYRKNRSILPLALGRDTTGAAVCGDLTKMPHLLMAGATGTGKSVALNAYIISLLYSATPRDLRLIMVDPKMLELSLYEGVPHLLVPVVTDVKKAAAALANAVREMERRFAVMKELKVRSLDDYNRKVAKMAEAAANEPVVEEELEEGEEEAMTGLLSHAPTPEPIVHEHLPRIVVIVDEFADLMMTVGREVEASITRLAQKARAAGIHMILATQRPSVDVITGLIKANFPSRISFKVTSRPDSRTILDSVGAERLLGNGDMLWMAPATSFLQRIHGCYVGDEAVSQIVDHLKEQGDPDYKMDLLESPSDLGGDDDEPDFFDELYDKAVHLVTTHGQGSTSWLQRKLTIGYNRAARIMEHMEREGIVGAADGAKPRKVLARSYDVDE